MLILNFAFIPSLFIEMIFMDIMGNLFCIYTSNNLSQKKKKKVEIEDLSFTSFIVKKTNRYLLIHWDDIFQ